MKHTAIQEYEYWPARTRRRRFRSFWIGGLPLTRFVGHFDPWATITQYLYKPAITDAIYRESPLMKLIEDAAWRNEVDRGRPGKQERQ
jgi:hypothetical protein